MSSPLRVASLPDWFNPSQIGLIVGVVVSLIVIYVVKPRDDPAKSVKAVTITADTLPICELPATIQKARFTLGKMCIVPDEPEVVCFINNEKGGDIR